MKSPPPNARMLSMTIRAAIVPFSSLETDEQDLLRLASRARNRAQAPYSNYWVGAAILTDEDAPRTFHGCNVERVSYAQTTHAEQNALDSLVAGTDRDGCRKLAAVAVVAAPASAAVTMDANGIHVGTASMPKSVNEVVAPCGHCLQILWENCHGDRGVRLLSPAPNGMVVVTTMGDALPMAFGPETLGITP